jgi:hypothetical protein
MTPTPIEDLRKPHPQQKAIDATSAALLRATALEVLRRRQTIPETTPKPTQAR